MGLRCFGFGVHPGFAGAAPLLVAPCSLSAPLSPAQGPGPVRLHLGHGVCHQRRGQALQPLPRLRRPVLPGLQPDPQAHPPLPQPAGAGESLGPLAAPQSGDRVAGGAASSSHRPPSPLSRCPDAVLRHPRALRPGGPQVRLRCPEATGHRCRCHHVLHQVWDTGG